MDFAAFLLGEVTGFAVFVLVVWLRPLERVRGVRDRVNREKALRGSAADLRALREFERDA